MAFPWFLSKDKALLRRLPAMIFKLTNCKSEGMLPCTAGPGTTNPFAAWPGILLFRAKELSKLG